MNEVILITLGFSFRLKYTPFPGSYRTISITFQHSKVTFSRKPKRLQTFSFSVNLFVQAIDI